MKNPTLIGTAAACLMAAAFAAPAWSAPSDGMKSVSQLQPVWRTDVTGSRTEVVPLMKLVPGGSAAAVKLTGLSRVQAFDFGVRRDEVVSEATLDLSFTPSPALAPSGSQINFYLNGRLQRSVPISASMVGKPSQLTLKLSPKVIESVNQLTVEFIGHTPSVCENPADAAIWLDIAAESRLTLVKQRVRLANDLAAFPAPFVDTASNEPSVLPMVFTSAPTSMEKQAAAVLASIVGRMSDWRGADFPVFYNGTPAEGHFVVFATNERRPDFLHDLPKADGPMVTIADAPASLSGKMLVIQGRNDEDLLAAVRALGTDRPVMVGETFRVKKAEVPPVREAYDAPRWINTDAEIPFSKLMQYPGQLSARGHVMAPVQLPVKFAPDLFMVGDAELGMQIRYRYAKPMPEETAQLRTFVNGYLADSDTLAGRDGRGSRTVQLPAFYGAISVDDPMGATLTHSTSLGFSVSYERTIQGGSQDNCRSVSLIGHQMEIEPTSTLTVKGLFHHAELPNLKLFTRAGYPFTKYADLSQTAVFIPQDASRSERTTLRTTMGRMHARGAPLRRRVRRRPSQRRARQSCRPRFGDRFRCSRQRRGRDGLRRRRALHRRQPALVPQGLDDRHRSSGRPRCCRSAERALRGLRHFPLHALLDQEPLVMFKKMIISAALACAFCSASSAMAAWPVWDEFRNDALDNGRVVDKSDDRKVTTSEGQSYAMFFALVTNDQVTFDGLAAWTADNLSGGDLTKTLPAWLWGRGRGDKWGILDTNNATDSDMWIAWCVLEAGRLWKSEEYTKKGMAMLELLKKEVRTVDNLGSVVLPGRVGFEDNGTVKLNPSYYPLFLFKRFALEDAYWNEVYEGSLRMLLRSSPAGIAPDWALFDKGGRLVPPNGDDYEIGSYNAIRTYLWAGMMSPDDPNRAILMKHFSPMVEATRALNMPPEKIHTVNLTVNDTGPFGFGACLIPMLGNDRTAGLVRSVVDSERLSGESYYSSMLALYGRGWDEGRFAFDADGRLIFPKGR